MPEVKIYDISKFNLQAHLDLEQDLRSRKDGMFTFVIQVNNGDIVDYIVMEYENYGKPNTARKG